MKNILILLFTAIIFSSCSDSNDSVVPQNTETVLTFDAKAGNADFALNKDFVVGTRTYNFNKLRYWVSNIIFVNAQGVEYVVPNSYYLMEEVGDLDLTGTVNPGAMIYPANKRESITLTDIPEGDYKSIKFSIGIDARHNDNLSLQGGELSIANGMSNIAWMWHSSYIFSALAGTVKEGTGSKVFKIETGLNVNYKTLTIDMASPVNFSKTKGVLLNVDVTKIFDGLDLMTNPTINAATAPLMSTVAHNYATKSISFGSAIQ